MRNAIIKTGIPLGVLLLVVGCGTIIHGTTQQVGFSSSPSGAEVSINGQNSGTTPMIVDLNRKDNHLVEISLDGYQPYETTITRSASGWLFGNIIFGGLIGLVVDAASGGMYKLSNDQIDAELHNDYADSMSEGELYIAVVLEADPEWEKVGQLKPASSE